MNGELPLPSFDVDGFRAIRELSLPELGRVNLFVGRNNAGKTSLLEAIRLYLHRNERSLPLVLFEILREHSGFRPPVFSRAGLEPENADLERAAEAVEALFYGSFGEGSLTPIRLTPEPMPSTGLTIQLPWGSESGPDLGEFKATPRAMFLAPETAVLEMRSEARRTEFPMKWFVRRLPFFRPGTREPALMISASGLEPVRARECGIAWQFPAGNVGRRSFAYSGAELGSDSAGGGIWTAICLIATAWNSPPGANAEYG